MVDGNLVHYLILAAAVAMVVHLMTRQYVLASLLAAASVSALNLAVATWEADFEVNLGWAPFMLILGFVFASPAAFAVGLPFVLVRRRRRAKA